MTDIVSIACITGFIGDASLQLLNKYLHFGGSTGWGLKAYFNQHGPAESTFIAGGMMTLFYVFYIIYLHVANAPPSYLHLAIYGGLLDLSDKMKPLAKYYAPEAISKVTDTDGHIWGLPWDIGPAILWYREDLFEKYGVEPDSIKTWDDYIAAGKKIDAASGGKVKMAISNQILNQGGLFIVLAQDHTMLSQQLGSGWWDDQGNPILDNAVNIRAMKLLKRFRDEGITLNDITGEAEVATMKDASVATYAHAAWWQLEPKFLAPETQGVWGFMKIPAFETGGVRASNVG